MPATIWTSEVFSFGGGYDGLEFLDIANDN
jgi:hypothetical protein